MTNTNTCATCQYWFRFDSDPDDGKRRCVFHTGANGLKIEFGGMKPLKTAPEFGCTEWREDERKQS